MPRPVASLFAAFLLSSVLLAGCSPSSEPAPSANPAAGVGAPPAEAKTTQDAAAHAAQARAAAQGAAYAESMKRGGGGGAPK